MNQYNLSLFSNLLIVYKLLVVKSISCGNQTSLEEEEEEEK